MLAALAWQFCVGSAAGAACLAVHRLEVFLLPVVRDTGKRHLLFDHRDARITYADLVAGVDDWVGAGGRGVGEMPMETLA